MRFLNTPDNTLPFNQWHWWVSEYKREEIVNGNNQWVVQIPTFFSSKHGIPSLLSIVVVVVLESKKGRRKRIGIVSRECSHGPWQILKWLLSLIPENETFELPLFILHAHPFLAIRWPETMGSLNEWNWITKPTNQPFPFHFDGVYKGFSLYFTFLDRLLLIHFEFLFNEKERLFGLPFQKHTLFSFGDTTNKLNGRFVFIDIWLSQEFFVFWSLSERKSGFWRG